MFEVILYVVFFFFKQKTAYDMRISDWSSDVCSSDLNWVGGRKGSTMTISGRSKASMVAGGVQSACDKGTTVAPAASKIYNSHAISNDLLKSYETIGRASSRERVCQYV